VKELARGILSGDQTGEAFMISPSGQLTPQRLNRIISDLLNHRYVGVLSAEDGDTTKEFYFAGSGVKATTIGPRKSLPVGRFWLVLGVVQEDALEEALQIQRERGGLIGEILVDGGQLSDEGRTEGLTDQLVEEIADLFFWPGPRYHYRPGPQTRVGTSDKLRQREGVKSLSMTTNLAQVLMRAKVDGLNLKTAGRKLGGVDQEYRATPAVREVLFTKETFMALPAEQQKLLPLFTKPRSAGEFIEGAGIPWSLVLKAMSAFLDRKFIERVDG